MADETEVTEVPEAPQEEEAVEEAPQPAAAVEESEIEEAEEADVVATVEAAEAAAEPAGKDEVSEPVEAAEPVLAEEITVGEEEAAEAAEAAEPVEVAADVTEFVDELLSRGGDVYYYGTGRRKTASAQVRLYPSKEAHIVVNDKPVDVYFSRPIDLMNLKRPLRVTATEDMFRITVKVRGGGIGGQAGAIRHGIARALTKANPELRRTLRQEGSLTRDPRMKERKKPGLKRARKAPQYTKR